MGAVNAKNINQVVDGGDNTIIMRYMYYKQRHTKILSYVTKYHDFIDFNIQNKEGETLLMLACRFKHRELFDMLLTYEDVNLNICDKQEHTVLDYISTQYYLVQILNHKHYNDETVKYKPIINRYIRNGKCDMALMLIKYKNIIYNDYIYLFDGVYVAHNDMKYLHYDRDEIERFATYIYDQYCKPHDMSSAEYLVVLSYTMSFPTLYKTIQQDMTTKITTTDITFIGNMLSKNKIHVQPKKLKI
ncbi:MAG: hypothetical protein Faunusvirus4_9 [Faunusvirus sp.]|jgi:hypothetical protein|uniref:Ankyrin repeat protein n=1 Tax=Faunusvirus sp. TaxID=2487766 RepID=A0A3G4ZW89_9VIRU|nr:MAG: hypothetical protein Faunusvirus4_9 [Faunusvirus sp.]